MNSIAQKSCWNRVTKADPCPICHKPDWCAVDELGEVAKCMRISDGAFKSQEDGAGLGHFHQLRERGNWGIPQLKPTIRRETPVQDWARLHDRYRADITREMVDFLANDLMVSMQALHAIGIGWRAEDRCYTFPEYDGGGNIIGINRRYRDGRQKAILGSRRGLTVPLGLNFAEPVLVVEGASDVAACITIGLRAVGRHNNVGGADLLAELLRDAEQVIVLGENDQKADGRWPGAEGRIVAEKLSAAWQRPVPWAFPPDGYKDIRSWLSDHDAHLAEDLKGALV